MAIRLAPQPPPVSSDTLDSDADLTPGTAAAASRSRSARGPRCSIGASLACRFSSATSSGSGTKPSGSWLSDANERRKSPAAVTSTSDTAICATTSVPRTAKRRSPATPRPASLSASPAATLFSPSTGATPATIADAQASAAVNPSTRQSSASSSDTLLSHVLNCRTRRAPLQLAKTSPRAAPAIATIRLSVKSSRASRQREPPSAILTLSSRRRASARATSRLAMFVHATSSRSPTATTIAKSGVSNCRAQRRLPVVAERQRQWTGEIARGSCCPPHRSLSRRGSAAARRGARHSPARGSARASAAPSSRATPSRPVPTSFPDLE